MSSYDRLMLCGWKSCTRPGDSIIFSPTMDPDIHFRVGLCDRCLPRYLALTGTQHEKGDALLERVRRGACEFDGAPQGDEPRSPGRRS